MPDPVQPVQPEAAPAAAAPEAAAPVAAPEGQGGQDTTSGLYNLDTIPEAIRGQVEPLFKEFDGNVTREFQKRAEAWKPYEELGIRDIDPEEMAHLVTFHQIASDEAAFKDWVKSAYDELHGENAGAAPEGAPAEEGKPQEGEQQFLTAEEFERKLEERETQRDQERQQQELYDTVAREARETLDTLLKDVPADDRQDIEDLVAFKAQKHQDGQRSVAEALKLGFADYQRLIGGAKSDALDENLAQPKPAENGGRAASQPKAAESFEEAGDRLRERMRASAAV